MQNEKDSIEQMDSSFLGSPKVCHTGITYIRQRHGKNQVVAKRSKTDNSRQKTRKDSANKIWSNFVTILEDNVMKMIIGHNVDYTIAYPRTGLSPDTLKKQNQVIYSE
jgi:hypothetical protein